MVVQHALERSLQATAEAQQITADAVLAGVDAARADLERAVVGEQIDDLVPQHLVRVIAVAALQILDLVDVGDTRGAVLDCGEPRPQRGDARRRVATTLAVVGRRERDLVYALADARLAAAGYRVRVVIGRLVDLRVRAVRDRGRPVRRKIRERRIHRLGGFVPARRIRGRERLVPVDLVEFPDAVFLDVLVFVRAFGPRGARAVLANLDQRAPAALRRHAVRRHVHHALQDHVIEELTGLEALAADDAIVELGNPGPAEIDPRAPELGARARVVGE